MTTFEIICLAKSTKIGGTCIAGIKTDGSGWLRPVSEDGDGTLYRKHYILDSGCEPELFEIIRIPCLQPSPECHQPENWLIDPCAKWTLVGSPTLDQLQSLLNPLILKHSNYPELLGNKYEKISYDSLIEIPSKSSLAIIKPKNLQWSIISYDNKKKIKASFLLNGNTYDLSVTDPIWKSQMENLNEGTYSCLRVIEELEIVNFDPDNFLLTISLGKPFIPTGYNKKYCYKLVAAVINVQDIKTRLGFL